MVTGLPEITSLSRACLGRADRAELASAAKRAGVAGTNDVVFIGLVCAAPKDSPSP